MAIMSSRSATAVHAAGIFADMTLDGPEIGTLVAVIDRARNLPNRRTMGKQDPYCAMRLGKEAKKTETDRRGGQTPKWDQELRFTVREAPDYYRLKCSVFNDDKKTELIGESWVDLKDVVVAGGGQNDLWHQLQFKGKYAGEIRMELTYYDTRPKDEAVVERRREKSRHHSHSTTGGSESGSKQLGPREIKRRPLPPSPAGAAPSSNPLPEPPQQPYQTYEDAILPRQKPPVARFDDNRSQVFQFQQQTSQYHGGSVYGETQHSQDYSYDDLEPYEEVPPIDDYNQLEYPTYEEAPPPSHYESQPTRQMWDDKHETSQANPSPSTPSWSSPSSIPPSVEPTDPRTTVNFKRYSTSPIKNAPFRDSPLRQSMSHHEEHEGPDFIDDELPPPLPPAHRHTSGSFSPMVNSLPVQPTIPTSPLDARSPLQTIERAYDPFRSSPLQPPQQALQKYSPSYGHYSEDQFRHSTGSYAPKAGQGPPPRSASYDPMNRHDDYLPEDFRQRSGDAQQDPHQQQVRQPPPRSSTFDERHVYTSTPPLFRPRAVSPNPPRNEVRRRSISANPSTTGQESLGSAPFNPDSYEAINPVSSSPKTSQPQSPAETSTRGQNQERDRLCDLGPIIGNDGREIDPTDHLPSDTWAPEPERKNRKPEVVIRFRTKEETRRTPASSPAAARPQSFAGTSSPASPFTESPPAKTGRNRLQKQLPNRPLPVQPYQHANSSPAVAQQTTPTRPPPSQPFHPHSSPSVPQRHSVYGTPSPRSNPMRPLLSEYAVNSNEINSSPPHHSSPYDNITLPPVPAKIPLYHDDQLTHYTRPGTYDSLSAELSSIDIGPSRAGRTGLRSSRGYGY